MLSGTSGFSGFTLNNTNDDNRNYFFGLESFFFSITSIGVPLIIGTFISMMDGKQILGFVFDVTLSYQAVTLAVVIITVIACIILWRGDFKNPEETEFLYFRFTKLWRKMLSMAMLKGMVQGFLVTAPAILVLKLVGDEGVLGVIQGISGALTALLVYVLGRIAHPEDRIKIFVSGLVLFFVGTLFNGILYSALGVILFVLCKVIFQPLFDLAYFPIMMRTIDAAAKIEQRNEYAYILSHEFGLFAGRAFGLLLFLFLAYCFSQDFALKYALVIVGALQLLAYPLAKNIIKETDLIMKN